MNLKQGRGLCVYLDQNDYTYSEHIYVAIVAGCRVFFLSKLCTLATPNFKLEDVMCSGTCLACNKGLASGL